MWTVKNAAFLWMKAHTPEQWETLLSDHEHVLVLNEEVMTWLDKETSKMGPAISLQVKTMERFGEKKPFERFKNVFATTVSAALDQFNKQQRE